MHLKLFVAAGAAALLLTTPARARAADCCDMPCCQTQQMACCKDDMNAIDILLSMDSLASPQLTPAPPVRQATDVWFMRPVMVGKSILQGHYVIEHDNDRMARGEPCTHIYAFEDREKPVVTFHCTHLERNRAKENIAVLTTKGDMQYMTEFQFAGETASHGVPSK